MNEFEKLFGLKPSQLKKPCILMPWIDKGVLKDFGVEKSLKGSLYTCWNSEFFTLIHTGIGAGFVGDAVLYLEKTECENIILFGSCGLVKEKDGFKIGSLTAVSKAFALESFSDLLLKKEVEPEVFYADKVLLDKLFSFDKTKGIKRTDCATVGSLKLEEENLGFFKQKNISVVDMECSAFYAAAAHIKRKALALLYVSDIIGKKNFYSPISSDDKTTLSLSIKYAVNFLSNFAKHLANS